MRSDDESSATYLPCPRGDIELVARLLSGGTPGPTHVLLASRVLEDIGGLRGLARSGRTRLLERGTLTAEQADVVLAALSLSKRLEAAVHARRKAPKLASPQAIAAWAIPRLGYLDREEVWALMLDTHCALLGARRVAQGGICSVALDLPTLFREVASEGGRIFVLVHNHPSGDARPSAEDIAFTKRVARAAAIIDVPLADHVVVAGKEWACVPFETERTVRRIAASAGSDAIATANH